MTAYKLVRQLKDGSLSSLFIRRRDRLPVGVWLQAECVPTKGFAVRKGWHCTAQPNAPHLSKKNRVWAQVEIEDYETLQRPESQGGLWFLANRMKITGVK